MMVQFNQSIWPVSSSIKYGGNPGPGGVERQTPYCIYGSMAGHIGLAYVPFDGLAVV